MPRLNGEIDLIYNVCSNTHSSTKHTYSDKKDLHTLNFI